MSTTVEQPHRLARRMVAFYVVSMLTLVVILQGVAAIRLAADNRADIERTEVQTAFLRDAQIRSCVRFTAISDGLRTAIQTVQLDPDTLRRSIGRLERVESRLSQFSCDTALSPE